MFKGNFQCLLVPFLLFLTIVLSSCTSLNTKITVYHQPHIKQKIMGKTYAYYPLSTLHQYNNLHYDFLSHQIDTYLKPYLKKAPKAKADVYIVLLYWVGRDKPYIAYQPTFGRTGTDVTGSFTTGNVNATSTQFSNENDIQGNLSSQTTYITHPRYGITGYLPVEKHLFPYYFDFYIYQKNQFNAKKLLKNKPLYSAELVAVAHYDEPTVIFPLIIKGLFQLFPGKNGSTTMVNVIAQHD